MNENDAQKLYERAANVTANENQAVVHVRVAGRSRDIALALLDVGAQSTDAAVKEAVARFTELPASEFQGAIVERHENGNLTVRPEAVFG